MRWVPWLLGIAGVVQYAIIAWMTPEEYVTVDMAYLVMWIAIVGALVVCYLSYGGGCCCDDGSCHCRHDDGPLGQCDCCEGHCHCGDCDACDPDAHGHGDGGHGNGHGGHTH